MTKETNVQKYDAPASTALQPADVLRQAALIQEVMRGGMKEGEHYGKPYPNADKPTLLQPGSQKLLLLFRLAPYFAVQREEIGHQGSPVGGGHRDYIVRCSLTHITTGTAWGEGMGSCSTLEAKYRYRPGPVTITATPVPQEYWELRKANPSKAKELIGGEGRVPKKDGSGKWMVALQGDPVEHHNPADHYNTVLKMACKRALAAAVLNATAASDIFSQDLEDIKENLQVYEKEGETAEVVEPPDREKVAVAPPKGNVQEKQEELPGDGKTMTRHEYCQSLVKKLASHLGVSEETVVRDFTRWKDTDGKEHEVSAVSELTPRWLGKTIGKLEGAIRDSKLA